MPICKCTLQYITKITKITIAQKKNLKLKHHSAHIY